MKLLLGLPLSTLFGLCLGIATWQDPAPAVPAPASLAAAAASFLASLEADELLQASAPLGDEARRHWGFVPATYPGISLVELDSEEGRLATGLLRAALSHMGMQKVEAIRALESVLFELESKPDKPASHRDPFRYWIQVFGVPDRSAIWAFRLQGHHVSLLITVVADRVHAISPQFLGTNPHELRERRRRGERVLAVEEDLARAILAISTDEQWARICIAEDAPNDILLGPGRKSDALGGAVGLAFREMTALQQGLLLRLVEEFVRLRNPADANAELDRIHRHGHADIHFAWAGSRLRGRPHYYRIHGPTFVIEYDNTQNDANHVHSVMRDLERDFGEDVLERHIREHHRPGGRQGG